MVWADLPPTRSGLRLPVAAGVWTTGEVDLNELADALNIEAALSDANTLKSIPDAWAQVEIARHALTAKASGGRHAAADAVTREWRALLALFALAPQYSTRYELIIEPYNLPAPPPPNSQVPANKAFLAVLASLPPSAKLHTGQSGWNKLGFLSVRPLTRGTPRQPVRVGILTPDLLVTPTRQTASAHLPGVPWFQNGPRDPVEIDDLNGRDYYILARYLDQLRQYVLDQPPEVLELTGSIGEALKQYHDACIARAGTEDLPLNSVIIPALRAPTDFHERLLHTFEVNIKEIPLDHGPCYLKLRPSVLESVGVARQGLKGMVLLDEAVAAARGSAPNLVRAWRGHLLSEVKDDRVVDAIKADAAAEGYLAVTADELFCPDFIELEKNTDIAGHPLGGFKSSLLPLSPLALLLFDPKQIANAIAVEKSGAGDRFVTLSLPMQDGRVVGLTRSYVVGAAENPAWPNIDRPSGLTIWPNFRHPNWPWNFLRFQYNPSGTDLQIRFGASGGQIAEDILATRDPLQCELRARQWANQSSCEVESRILANILTPAERAHPILPLQRLRFVNTDDSVGEIQISEKGFEAIFFARKPGKDAVGVRPAGMILLETTAIDQPKDRAPTLAIDFGSTNTVAATDADLPLDVETRDELGLNAGGRPHALVFSTCRTVFPIKSSEAMRQSEARAGQAWAQLDFFPLIAQPTPIPSVMIKRVLEGVDTPVHFREDERPLFPASIFFLTAFYAPGQTKLERRISEITLKKRPYLVFNLKYAKNKTLTGHFLRQFVIMCAAELAARGYDPSTIQWRFSYPEAMKGDDIDYLEQTYRDFAQQLFPPPHNPTTPSTVLSFTEGEAAATYFLEKNIGDLAVVLDIGGSTTDIAVWMRDGPRQMIWHGSVRIAGGHFMTHYLVNNPAFLEQLKMEEVTALVRESANEKSDLLAPVREDSEAQATLRDVAELFFSDERFRGSFETAYRREAATGLGQGLRHSATAALGGVLYYVGKVLGQMAKTSPKLAEALKQPTIAFAGRGALFFRELGRPDPDSSTRLQGLAAVMAAAAGVEGAGHAKMLFSPEPKLEAVLGMSQSGKLNIGPASTEFAPWLNFKPAGEVVMVKGEPLDAWASVDDVIKRESGGAIALTEFEAFLDVLSKKAGLAIDLRGGSPGTAQHEILNYVSAQVNRARNEVKEIGDYNRLKEHIVTDTESVFISALRALLDCLGRDAASRTRLLGVAEKDR